MSDAGFNFLMGYIVFFCTDVLLVNPLLVGTLFALSKVIDGVTDIIAGYIVDRTNTKWGRGRPYDVCLIGAWVSVIMIFLCPVGWDNGVKTAWIVFWYILANSVFYTFLNAGEGVFMLRAFNKAQIVKMTAQGNIATSLLGFSCGIVLPQLVNNAGKDPAAWTRLAITVAIPLTLIGLCRMLFVKEENDTVKIVEEKVKTDLKDIFRMLGKNKYWGIFCFITLLGNVVSNMGVAVYYFDKVLGNLGIQSVFAAASVLAVFALVLLPPLMKRFTCRKSAGSASWPPLYLPALLHFYKNIPILVICYVASMFARCPACTPPSDSVRRGHLQRSIWAQQNGRHDEQHFWLHETRRFRPGNVFAGVALTVIQYDAERPRCCR